MRKHGCLDKPVFPRGMYHGAHALFCHVLRGRVGLCLPTCLLLSILFDEKATGWQRYEIISGIGTPITWSTAFSPVRERGRCDTENAIYIPSLGCTGSGTL